VIVCFVDIDHHCLNFVFALNCPVNRPLTQKINNKTPNFKII